MRRPRPLDHVTRRATLAFGNNARRAFSQEEATQLGHDSTLIRFGDGETPTPQLFSSTGCTLAVALIFIMTTSAEATQMYPSASPNLFATLSHHS